MGHHHKFDPKKLYKLKDPKRLIRENPETIWKNFSLDNPTCLIDIGGGIGFCAIPFAKKMPRGTVWVCDISVDMLAELKNEIKKAGVTNVKPLLMAEVDVPLPDSLADGILMQNLHHELKHPQNSLKECKRLLKPNGKLAIIDWKKGKMAEGPPYESRVTESDIENDLSSAGFTDIEKFTGLPYHSFLIATI